MTDGTRPAPAVFVRQSPASPDRLVGGSPAGPPAASGVGTPLSTSSSRPAQGEVARAGSGGPTAAADSTDFEAIASDTTPATGIAPPGWDRVRDVISRSLSSPALAIEPGSQGGETPWRWVWALLAGLLGVGGTSGAVVVRRRLRSLTPPELRRASPPAEPVKLAVVEPEAQGPTATASDDESMTVMAPVLALVETEEAALAAVETGEHDVAPPTVFGEERATDGPAVAEEARLAEMAGPEEPASPVPTPAEAEEPASPVLAQVTVEKSNPEVAVGVATTSAASTPGMTSAEAAGGRAERSLGVVASALTDVGSPSTELTGRTSHDDALILEALTQASWPARGDWASATPLSGTVVHFGGEPSISSGGSPSDNDASHRAAEIDSTPATVITAEREYRVLTYSPAARERRLAAAQQQLDREARLAGWALVALPVLVLLGRSALDISYLPRMGSSLGGVIVLLAAAALTLSGYWGVRSFATGGGLTPGRRLADDRVTAAQAELTEAVELAATVADGTASLEEAVRRAADHAETPMARMLVEPFEADAQPLRGSPDQRAVRDVAGRLTGLVARGGRHDVVLWLVASELQTARLRRVHTRLERLWLRALLPATVTALPAVVLLVAVGW